MGDFWLRRLRFLLIMPMVGLAGCGRSFWLFHPKGPVASAEFRVTVLDVSVMMLVVLTAGIMAAVFLFRYRKGRHSAYDPTFVKSDAIEIAVWGIPLMIVGFLAYNSYKAISATNPYNPKILANGQHRPLSRKVAEAVNGGRPVGVIGPVAQNRLRPVHIDVITTDWQWLFLYPKADIASVNALVVPVNRPIYFRLTSATVVNDFFIPELVGEIDVMPGMRTRQAMLVRVAGTYRGFSADYSGGGFSWMGFAVHAVSAKRYAQWTARIAKSPQRLTYARFNKLAQPTINVGGKTDTFSHVQKGLFRHVVQAVMNGKVYTTPMGMTENMLNPVAVRITK